MELRAKDILRGSIDAPPPKDPQQQGGAQQQADPTASPPMQTKMSATEYYQRLKENKSTQKQTQAIGHDEYKQLEERFNTDPISVAQADNLSLLREKLKAFQSAPKEMDLTGVMKLADFATRDQFNIAEGYKPNMTAKDRKKFEIDLHKMVNKAHTDMQKSQNDFFKSQLQNYLTTGQLDRISQSTQDSHSTGTAKLLTNNDYEKSQAVIDLNNFKKLKDHSETYWDLIKNGWAPRGTPEFNQQVAAGNKVIVFYNQMAELGALTGADLRMLQSVVGMPAKELSPSEWVAYLQGGGEQGSLAAMQDTLAEIRAAYSDTKTYVESLFDSQNTNPNVIKAHEQRHGSHTGRGPAPAPKAAEGSPPAPATDDGADKKAEALERLKARRRMKQKR